jgi:2-aminoethylphosphonate-pyruvate transaminase
MVLFNPGPVNLAEEVRSAMLRIELCHRQPEFAEVVQNVRTGLYAAAGLSGGEHRLGLLHGSGTLAVDAALTTFVRGKTVVIDNGVYSQRLLTTLAGIEGAVGVPHAAGLGVAVDLERLEDDLARERPDWIGIVHHETTTGLLNRIEPVSALARRHGARLFVDAVSSLGAHAVDASADVICFNSNKCLESLPGIAGVFFKADLDGHATVPVLDVTRYHDGMPSTPHVQAFLAMEAALDLLRAEDRPARYERLARAVWEAGSEHFEPLLAERDRSHVLTSFRLDGRDYESLSRRALERRYVIYAGQGQLFNDIFRVANMGALIDEALIADLFAVLSS